ncbi:MAG: GFA family protein [Granulosicoccus sp.]
MVNGSCLCGKVTFAARDAFTDMSHCHCSICRKMHGSLFATYLDTVDYEITSGIEWVRTYVSSPGFNRVFCGECGSTLPERDQDGLTYIPAGLLDDDPGIRPSKHIFTESKSAAYTIYDDLPQLEYYGDGNLSRVVKSTKVNAKAGVVSGGCQCGEVAFEYTGTPKFAMNCHCSRCRKVKGAAHATNVFVPIAQLTWLRGEGHMNNFDLPGAERFGNAFCRTCGSSVPRESSATGMFNIPAGSLNESPGVDAKGHIFVGSKAPWFEISDALPQWDEMPS